MWRRSPPTICGWLGRFAPTALEAGLQIELSPSKKPGGWLGRPASLANYRVAGYLTNTEMLTLTVWPPGP
jgi:hypothetical protein